MLCPHRLAAHLKLCPYTSSSSPQALLHRLAQLTSSSDTLSIAARLMLCYAVWDSSHQALLHRLAQLNLMLCYTV